MGRVDRIGAQIPGRHPVQRDPGAVELGGQPVEVGIHPRRFPPGISEDRRIRGR
ncbi:MAG: hypothetical protein ACRDRZ_03060 [Pseudonocardiaceae bacterium]